MPVDAKGWVSGTSDLDGSFTGAVELAQKMAASRGVRECVTSKWLGYALGIETPPLAAVSPLADAFIAKGRDMRELLVELVTSDTFRLRPLVIPAL